MNVAVAPAVPEQAPRAVESIDESPEYIGTAANTLGIVLLNALITPLTLGFYRFWGKTRLRRYVWHAIRFRGDPLEYTGRGSELLIGFIVAAVVLVALSFGYGLLTEFLLRGPNQLVWQGIANAVLALVFLYLVYYATYRARRYQMSRTLWRGIRFGQTGSAWRYAARAFGWMILRVLTLNLVAPWAAAALQRFRTGHTWIGGSRMSFDGKGGPLFWRWVAAWLLLLPTLGLSYLWFYARQYRHFARHTRLDGIAFDSSLRGRNMLSIYLPYGGSMLVLLAAVAGLVGSIFVGAPPDSLADPQFMIATVIEHGLPQLIGALVLWYVVSRALAAYFLIHRQFALSCRTLRIHGAADFAAIAQAARAEPRFGEGLADALDIGGMGGV